VFGTFVVVYLGTVAFGSSVADMDLPDARLLLPAYAPIVILVIAAVDSITGHGERSVSERVSGVLAISVLALLVVAPMAYVVAVSGRFGASDRHDVRDAAVSLSILDSDRPETEFLVSNKPYLVFLRWGEPVGLSPRAEACREPRPYTHFLDVSALKRLASDHGGVTLVWLGADQVSIESGDGYRVTRVSDTEDGTILHIKPIGDSATD
jgi:hypothetical protein